MKKEHSVCSECLLHASEILESQGEKSLPTWIGTCPFKIGQDLSGKQKFSTEEKAWFRAQLNAEVITACALARMFNIPSRRVSGWRNEKTPDAMGKEKSGDDMLFDADGVLEAQEEFDEVT